jgi:hypothetical protein
VIARKTIALLVFSAALLALPAAARADFGLVPGSVSAVARNKDGTIDNQAGSHPFTWTIKFKFNTNAGGHTEGGEVRDIITDLPPGFVGNPQAVPRCSRQDFEGFTAECPTNTQIGVLHVSVPGLGQATGPLFNTIAPPGTAGQIGFSILSNNALENASVRSSEGYGLEVGAYDIPIEVSEITEVIWGAPADPGHDPERGPQAGTHGEVTPSDAPQQPYLTLPAQCESSPEVTVKADSNLAPGIFDEQSAPSLDAGGNPAPLAGCDGVPFSPKISSQPTTKLASNPSGLDFELKLPNQGLLGPGAITETEPKKTVVTLPQGVTVNPSLAEGIGVCSEAQYAKEQIESKAGEGCPEASKLGSVIAQSPLLEEPIEGSVYLAAPYANPFGTLTALYLVARAPERGILVKQAGKVELNGSTGQITTTFEDLPPVPFSSFKLHFREGARAPLATPQACGEYRTLAQMTPFSASSDSEAITREAAFQILRGPEGGACPSGGTPPFHPGLIAGSINNAAGSYSPFNVRMFRNDSEQEITHFSIKLPPGVAGKLAGIPFCSDAAIAAAAARTGSHGGQEELESPSCPAASQVGRTLAGAGVGQTLAYAPGKLYLAGPYHGAPVSIVSITSGVVGPFDIGTIVVRLAVKVNPETGEVFLDSSGSDPIPHIIKGIPVHLRDIRAYTDRPEFTFNPTSCEETSTSATVLGSGLDFASEADDNPFVSTSRFQAADCAALPFKPKLTLKLKGSTKRAGNPALQAHLAMNGFGEAGLAYAQVALPANEFLDNDHIGTVCTRVQFKEGATEGEKCPKGSIIGNAKAVTPVLEVPLEGPIYLRANPERNLPDIAADLHGQEISVVAVGHVDSAPGGGLRNTFEVVPDAPITSVDIDLFGGNRGLLENSPKGLANTICKSKSYAKVKFTGHNGKQHNFSDQLVATGCKKQRRSKRSHRSRG